MSAENPSILHISDTARWAAVYRARETERPDALFRDPFARRLAGERGEQIAASLPFHDKHAWSWVARTVLFDSLIASEIERGADTIVNLAAGLDARPYRMDLNPGLKWVEVDLPEILRYKETVLGNEPPKCRLRRVGVDLADAAARQRLFDELSREARRAVVLTEGLLIYLTAEEAGGLARDLAARRGFQSWILDIVSPSLLRMIQRNTQSQFHEDVTPLQFAPPEGPAFFSQFGWEAAEVRSPMKTAAQLKRLPLSLRLVAMLPENPRRAPHRPWSGICLLKKSAAAAGTLDTKVLERVI